MTRILIAAAGTGGHLFPALYLAQAFKEEEPNCEVQFVGVGRPLESKILDSAGFKRSTLRIEGVRGRGLLHLMRWFRDLPKPILDCWRIFQQFKPDIVVGVGGYVSVVPVIMARILGIKSWIHEAEAQLGLANKLLILFANQISLAYPTTKVSLPSRARYTGHPLRPQLKQELFLSNRKKRSRLLVVGGSQGAAALDRGMIELAPKLWEMGVREILHQTRPENKDLVARAYESHGFTVLNLERVGSGRNSTSAEDSCAARQVEARVVSFLSKIEEAYAWADVIIARTGAGTTRELLIVNRPTICIPFPSGHEQLENAKILAAKGIGIIVEEGRNDPSAFKNWDSNEANAPVSRSLSNEEFFERLKRALELALDSSRFNTPLNPEKSIDETAARVIAQGCLRLVAGKKGA